MKRLFLLLLVLQVFNNDLLLSQDNNSLRIAFWNLENFFDPFVDSTRTYNEYAENGNQKWNMQRFYRKRNNIYKTILALSESEPLAIFGMCEIENVFVTAMLFQETPLKKHNYRVVHFDGNDRRGIDVALAYSIDKLMLISSESIKVKNPNDKNFRTRDILYAKFFDRENDTLHCFVNHWTSRYGGERETIHLRSLTASLLKSKIDSLIMLNEEMPKIIIMGDFNDSPEDYSLANILNAKPEDNISNDGVLVNLFYNNDRLGFEGTLKHQYRWQIFDQIIVSNSLYNNNSGLHYKDNSARIFHADFLFISDDTYGGKKLFRTYVGPKYQGGYSDHLPVYIDLKY